MQLSKISNIIDCLKVYNFKKKDNSFNFISTHTRYIKKSSIFVVDKNSKFKKKYIDEAISKGAIALITNYHFKSYKLPQFVVKNVKESLKKILLNLLKFSPKNAVGITGTNGKTSVVWNISSILYFNNIKVRMYGTLGYYKDLKKIKDSYLTTPEYEILYQNSHSRNYNKRENFIFEVSSHSISKNRIKDFPINIAALTNITQDHLDFHKSLNNYKNAKFKLFLDFLDKNGTAVINDTIKGISKLKKRLMQKKIKIVTYGKPNSNIYIFYINNKLTIKIFDNYYSIKFIDFNYFQLENLACSVGCCLALGLKDKDIIKVIPKIQNPKGRAEVAGRLNNGSKILVDYAHTPDALKNILLANVNNKRKPSVVFGCGGNREVSKRRIMGNIANKFANKVYITDDNPRNENPSKIRKKIITGCKKAIEIPSRELAIKTAINDLEKNETLIIAGKGHENKQIIRKKIIKFDDLVLVKKILNKKN